MHEFELIEKYFTHYDRGTAVVLGNGDDCALLNPPLNTHLAITTDTLNEGVHFFKNTPPRLLGERAIRVNLSDLDAMGAVGLGFTLSLTLPVIDEFYVKELIGGMFSYIDKEHPQASEGQRRASSYPFSFPLIGGNTTKGPLSITITAFGAVPEGKALRRDAAKVGDGIYVTGTLGLPALYVAHEYGEIGLDCTLEDYEGMLSKLKYLGITSMSPAHGVGRALLDKGCYCAIDLSDGLSGDLSHILKASKVGAEIELESLPVDELLYKFEVEKEQALDLAVNGGGDYQLLFTLELSLEERVRKALSNLGCTMKRIGKIVPLMDDNFADGPQSFYPKFLKNGKIYHFQNHAFEHF